jgi:co-chaperonin GroES (HSP10)
MQFRPLHDRVLVRRIEAEEKFGDGRRHVRPDRTIDRQGSAA